MPPPTRRTSTSYMAVAACHDGEMVVAIISLSRRVRSPRGGTSRLDTDTCPGVPRGCHAWPWCRRAGARHRSHDARSQAATGGSSTPTYVQAQGGSIARRPPPSPLLLGDAATPASGTSWRRRRRELGHGVQRARHPETCRRAPPCCERGRALAVDLHSYIGTCLHMAKEHTGRAVRREALMCTGFFL